MYFPENWNFPIYHAEINPPEFFLPDQLHFIQQISGSGKLIDHKQGIPDIERDISASIRIEKDVTHGTFPATVEIDADQFSIGIDDRTSWIAPGGVVGGAKGHWHFPCWIGVGSIVFALIQHF